MRFDQVRHGQVMRRSNRFGGDQKKEILEDLDLPKGIKFIRLNRRVLARETVEETRAWQECCIQQVHSSRPSRNGRSISILVYTLPTPARSNPQPNPNGRFPERDFIRKPFRPRRHALRVVEEAIFQAGKSRY